jgi:hypothetical protein
MIPSTKDIGPSALGNLETFRTKQLDDVTRLSISDDDRVVENGCVRQLLFLQ